MGSSFSVEVYSGSMIQKRTVMIGAIAGMTLGGAAPMLFGDYNTLDLWSVLGGFVGGIAGIWLAATLSRYFGD